MPEPLQNITPTEQVAVANQTPAPTPASPPAQTPAQAPQAAPPTQPTSPPSFLESLKGAGVQIDAADEQTAISQLAKTWKEYQNLQRLAPAAQAYLQNRDQFTAWQKAQEEEARKQQAQSQPQKAWWSQWWNPPDYNPAWMQMVRRNEDGELVPLPGAPIGVVEKIQQYEQFRREQADKLLANPFQFFEEPVKHLAQQIAQEQVQRHLQTYRDQLSAREFVNRESAWLYEHDASGNRKFQQILNPQTGRLESQPVLSPLGQKLRDYVTEEAARQQQRGYYDLEEQQQNAMRRVQLDYLMQQMANQQQPVQTPAPQAPPQTPRQQANQQFLNQNGGRPGTPATPANVTPPSQPRRDLAEIMRERFKQNGITDESLVTNPR